MGSAAPREASVGNGSWGRPRRAQGPGLRTRSPPPQARTYLQDQASEPEPGGSAVGGDEGGGNTQRASNPLGVILSEERLDLRPLPWELP